MTVMVEKQMEMRGMKRQELVEYFVEIGGLVAEPKCMKGMVQSGAAWQVTLSEQSIITLGSLSIPSTTVTIRTDATAIDAFVADFRLRFLSAGG